MPSPKLPEQLSTAIMCRDRSCCVFCGASKTRGATVSVDHLRPRSWGGTDDPRNLVCACRACNDLKGTSDVESFAAMVDRYKDSLPDLERFKSTTGAAMLARVAAAIATPLDPIATRDALALIRASRRAKG